MIDPETDALVAEFYASNHFDRELSWEDVLALTADEPDD